MNARILADTEKEELRESVVDALFDLADVAFGDYSSEIMVDFDSDNPVSIVFSRL